MTAARRCWRRLEELQHQLEESGGWTLHQEVERVLNRLDLDAEAEFTSLSGGTKRRVLLARALVSIAGHPAPGRTDQPPGHRHHPLAGGVPGQERQDRAVRDPRPGLCPAAGQPGRGDWTAGGCMPFPAATTSSSSGARRCWRRRSPARRSSTRSWPRRRSGSGRGSRPAAPATKGGSGR